MSILVYCFNDNDESITSVRVTALQPCSSYIIDISCSLKTAWSCAVAFAEYPSQALQVVWHSIQLHISTGA
ncbi:hypothetical protein T06_10871 [Trichinella sp. T6]|nr:hypothetical protein T06_10871 [Trichinella sp. T6]